MKKTAEELAELYVRGVSFSLNKDGATLDPITESKVLASAKISFIDGYNKAQEWISVDDRLPEEREYFLASKDGGKSWYIELCHCYAGRWFMSSSPQEVTVTHWREI